MALPRLGRVVAVLVVIWIAVGIVALVLFYWPGEHPGEGKGDQITLSGTP